MATYDNLPVYKVSYDLLVDLFQFTKDFKKEYKYTIGQSIKQEVIEMITNIYRANSLRENRVEKIQHSRENIETIRLFLRLLKDLKQVNLKKFAKLSEQVESVSKQLAAWQRYSEK